jgi:hypothetical protein
MILSWIDVNDINEKKSIKTPLIDLSPDMQIGSLPLTQPDDNIPEDIINWLSELSLLYGCPNHYLIPVESLLPPESIRFFYLDPNWIISLMDGACSIGRKIHDEDNSLSADWGFSVNKIRLDEITQNNVRTNRHYKAADDDKIQKNNKKIPVNTEETCTGFLLKSCLIKDYTGLEFKAFGDSEAKELQILRIDKISNDTLLGIFRGKISTLEILEPPEGLHFGTDAGFKKILRDVQTGAIKNKVGIEVLVNNETRVVNISGTVENMKSKLGTDITSAEFALEMIENPAKGIITNRKK